jgi:Uma2 family endonuclease
VGRDGAWRGVCLGCVRKPIACAVPSACKTAPAERIPVILKRMRAVLLDPPMDLLESRRRSGVDRFDEVWDGVLHMVPAPNHAHASIEAQLIMIVGPSARTAGLEMIGQSNLGESEHDYRVPDSALHRPGAFGIWHPTAALVVEIVSPGDESWEKLPFYADHDVDEVLIVDPAKRSVDWLGLQEGEYRPIERSGLIELGASELGEQIDWPSVE